MPKTEKIPLLFPLLKRGTSREAMQELFEAHPPLKRRWPKAGGLKEENSNNQYPMLNNQIKSPFGSPF